jgi:hypothetical protein
MRTASRVAPLVGYYPLVSLKYRLGQGNGLLHTPLDVTLGNSAEYALKERMSHVVAGLWWKVTAGHDSPAPFAIRQYRFLSDDTTGVRRHVVDHT